MKPLSDFDKDRVVFLKADALMNLDKAERHLEKSQDHTALAADREWEIRMIQEPYIEQQHHIPDRNDVWGSAGPDFRPTVATAA